MRGTIFLMLVTMGIMAWTAHQQAKDIVELRARINALEATVEPLAYFSVDFDNRLAKAEHSWRMEEENDDDTPR